MFLRNWFLGFVFVSVKFVSSQTAYYEITDKLFKSYDPFLRPVLDHETATKVEIRFGIIQLLDVVSGYTI